MTIKTPNLSLDHPAWKLAHRFYLDALAQQKPHVREALDNVVGDTFEGFLEALARGPLVIASRFLDDGLNYVVAIYGSDGLVPLARIHASRLGLDDDETKFAELLNGA